MADQEFRLYGRFQQSVGANPFFFVQHRLASLYADYRPGCLLWSVFGCVRKLLMLLATSLLHERPEVARRLVVAVLMGSLALHAGMRPYVVRLTELNRRKFVGPMYVLMLSGVGYPPDCLVLATSDGCALVLRCHCNSGCECTSCVVISRCAGHVGSCACHLPVWPRGAV